MEKVWESSPVSDATLAIMIGYGRQMRQQASRGDRCLNRPRFGQKKHTLFVEIHDSQKGRLPMLGERTWINSPSFELSELPKGPS